MEKKKKLLRVFDIVDNWLVIIILNRVKLMIVIF